jgi:hypothetical protein
MRNSSNRRTWQLIGATTALSLAITLSTGWALRAGAQDAPPPAQPGSETPAQDATAENAPATPAPAAPAPTIDEAGAEGDALPEDVARRAPVPVETPDPPELRESADNNISFPVDI